MGVQTVNYPSPVIFHSAATAIGTGITNPIGENKTLTVEIFGNAPVGANINFEYSLASGVFMPIQGYNETTGTLVSSASVTASPSGYTFDVAGKTSIRMNLTAITSGSVTVQGSVVA